MSTQKRKKKFGHGGAREGAGHPETGITKEKICVSVNKRNWQAAVEHWNGKASHLVDWLLSRHVKREKLAEVL